MPDTPDYRPIKSSGGKRKSDSSLFRAGDLKNPASLVVKLRDRADALSQYLSARFTAKTRQLLEEYKGSASLSGELHTSLVEEFNRLLEGASLYDEPRFAKIKLMEETRRLINQKPQGEELVRLNRLLLEEAYPHEIRMSRKLVMREGAFALIDCLGFKGIWKRGDWRDADELRRHQLYLLDKLSTITKEVPKLVKAGVRPYKHFSDPVVVGVNLLSDSVAISLQYDEDLPPKGRYKNYLAWLICESTIKVLDRFRKDEPTLVLRGCITYGEHTSKGNFIVGPAVDDASENMEVGQGAFIWLHPTAADKYRQCIKTTEATVEKLESTQDREQLLLLRDLKRALEKPLVVESYNMPLKVGGHLRCSVLNPFAFHKTRKEREEVKLKCLRAISGNQLDVLLKHQYTKDFLEAADKAWYDHVAEYAKFIKSLG